MYSMFGLICLKVETTLIWLYGYTRVIQLYSQHIIADIGKIGRVHPGYYQSRLIVGGLPVDLTFGISTNFITGFLGLTQPPRFTINCPLADAIPCHLSRALGSHFRDNSNLKMSRAQRKMGLRLRQIWLYSKEGCAVSEQLQKTLIEPIYTFQ